MEALPAEVVAKTTSVERIYWTLILKEVEVIKLLEVDTTNGNLTILIVECGKTLFIQSSKWDREDGANRIVLKCETGTWHEVDDAATRNEFCNLVLCVGEGEVGRPLEVARLSSLEVAGRESELNTVRLHLGNVGHLAGDTTHTLGVDATNQVVVVTLVPVEYQVDAVAIETEVNTHVKLVLLLVGELLVGNVREVEVHLGVLGEQAPWLVGVNLWQCVRNACRTGIGSQ